MRMGVRLLWTLMVCLSFTASVCTTNSLKTEGDPFRGQGQYVMFHRDVGNTFLMYEFLLGGLAIDEDSTVTLKDEELSSMRSAKVFHNIMNIYVPKTPTAIKERLAVVSRAGEFLEMDTFEQLLLAAVYTAHRAQRSNQTERQAWAGPFCQLVAAITHDLSEKVVMC
uniref:protein FAM180A n=1 Tax=Pristiophorus japonicus TaxID=55135 RepID=UPI00398ECD13